jgi:hypothetical protein
VRKGVRQLRHCVEVPRKRPFLAGACAHLSRPFSLLLLLRSAPLAVYMVRPNAIVFLLGYPSGFAPKAERFGAVRGEDIIRPELRTSVPLRLGSLPAISVHSFY